MDAPTSSQDGTRFALVSAAHDFVIHAVPFNDRSRHRLNVFAGRASASLLVTADVEAVLLRVLSVLDRYTGGRLPTLVDRYLARMSHDMGRESVVRQFHACVDDVLRYRGVGNHIVQRAIAVIDARYSDSSLTTRSIGEALDCRPELLAAEFNRETGWPIRQYLANVRLDRAARLLVETARSVKEVWAAVGYNHASNFDHEFKRRFRTTPLEYRSRAIHDATTAACALTPQPHPHLTPETILIVDDDEGMRQTLATYLRLEGYDVSLAESGAAALREAARVEPKAVLLDYHLPDMTGDSCLQGLRRVHPHAVIVMFSADWELEGRCGEWAAMRVSLLFKLCSLDDVKQALSAAMV